MYLILFILAGLVFEYFSFRRRLRSSTIFRENAFLFLVLPVLLNLNTHRPCNFYHVSSSDCMMQELRRNAIRNAIHAISMVCYFLGIRLARVITRRAEVGAHACRICNQIEFRNLRNINCNSLNFITFRIICAYIFKCIFYKPKLLSVPFTNNI